MRDWMPLWLFPVGVLGAVVLVSVGTVPGYLLATLWGLVVFPHGAAYLRRHLRGSQDAGGDRWADDDTEYWRTTLR